MKSHLQNRLKTTVTNSQEKSNTIDECDECRPVPCPMPAIAPGCQTIDPVVDHCGCSSGCPTIDCSRHNIVYEGESCGGFSIIQYICDKIGGKKKFSGVEIGLLKKLLVPSFHAHSSQLNCLIYVLKTAIKKNVNYLI